MSKTARLFIYEFPADEFPVPNPDQTVEVYMDAITDVGIRTILLAFKKEINDMVDPDFRSIDWTQNRVMTQFPLFEKHVNVDGPNTMWYSVRRRNSGTAFGFWMSAVSIKNL